MVGSAECYASLHVAGTREISFIAVLSQQQTLNLEASGHASDWLTSLYHRVLVCFIDSNYSE
jgi:hypothetical protein